MVLGEVTNVLSNENFPIHNTQIENFDKTKTIKSTSSKFPREEKEKIL